MRAERPTRFEWVSALAASVVVALGALAVRKATLLPGGFFDAMAAAALGLGFAPLAHRLLAAPAEPLTRGLGFAAAALLVASALLSPFDLAALPLACWMLGGGALAASVLARRPPIFAAVGVLLLALGIAAAWSAAATWPEPARLRWALAAGSALALVGLLARLVLARRAPRLAPSPVGVLLVAALAAGYLAYRPLVTTQVANLPLYEWTVGVGIAVLALGRLRRNARDESVPEAWSGDARRHEEGARPAYDARMAALAGAVQRYLDTGEGFEAYRAALLRAGPGAPASFRKALQGAAPVQGRGRAAKVARREREATHAALMTLLNVEVPPHGNTPAAVRPHP